MRMATWTFGKKLSAGFLVAALTLLVVAAVGYENAQRSRESTIWLSRAYDVQKRAIELMSTIQDVETGARGFVLSGQEAFLAPYNAASARALKEHEELRAAISDPNQLRRIEGTKPLIEAKISASARYIALRRKGGLEAAAAEVSAGEGDQLMVGIRGIIGEFLREERAIVERRRTEAQASADTTGTVIVWGSLLGSLFIAVVAWFITRSLTRQVGSAVRHIQSSSAELQSAANQQATGAKEQATAMNEITTTISELLATSRQIAESAQRVAQIASETAGAAESGDRLVQRTNESIASIKRQVDLVVGHMLDLGKRSQEIGGILEIINELAEQTNILAINATIEAAGAGDAGRRFSVVADEIRRLADRVAGSTKDIRQRIEEVRAAVNTTVMATETGTKAVDAGARQFAEAATAFGRIAELVVTTTEAAREIELSTKQQSTAVEQVNQAANNVAQATRETESSSGQTLTTASQLAGLSRDLLKVVQSTASP
jgi:methyl-accepting chemotaxis protein